MISPCGTWGKNKSLVNNFESILKLFDHLEFSAGTKLKNCINCRKGRALFYCNKSKLVRTDLENWILIAIKRMIVILWTS